MCLLLSFMVFNLLVCYHNCFFEDFYRLSDNSYIVYNKALKDCNYMIENELSTNPQLRMQYNIREAHSMSGKLFIYDSHTIGLVSTNHVTIYLFHLSNSSLVQISKRVFHHSLAPFDACVDKSKYMHVVFPDQYLIAKFRLMKISNRIVWKLVRSLVIPDFNPSAISCLDDQLYISERPSNEIRIYDNNHNFLRSILVHGVVLSIDKSISINHNLRVFIDGLSSVALFLKQNKHDDVSQACHFYFHKNCIHDVYTYIDTKTNSSNILMTDDCNKEVRHYILHQNSKILKLRGIIKTLGVPTTSIATDDGSIIIVTYNPRMIVVYNYDT